MDLRILSVSAVIGACSVAAFGQHEAAEMTQNSEPREFTGTYQSGPNAYLYMQIWNELSGTPRLVAFDESGTVRSLYPEGNGRFVAGTKAGVRDPVESTIQLSATPTGKSPRSLGRRAIPDHCLRRTFEPRSGKISQFRMGVSDLPER